MALEQRPLKARPRPTLRGFVRSVILNSREKEPCQLILSEFITLPAGITDSGYNCFGVSRALTLPSVAFNFATVAFSWVIVAS